jgi:hypothetical protein
MFTFSMSTSACIRDVSSAGASRGNGAAPSGRIDLQSFKTWRVGCVLREAQTSSHASSLIVKPCIRFTTTRPLFSRTAPAIAITSRLLEKRGLKLLRRLFPRSPFTRIELSISHQLSLVGPCFFPRTAAKASAPAPLIVQSVRTISRSGLEYSSSTRQ